MQSGGTPASTAASSGSSVSAPSAQTAGGVPSKPGNILRPAQQTSYHVPRGAAAVASIAMPRPSSLATVRSGPTGSLVSIRGSARAPSPASQQHPQQIRTRPASSSAHSGSRPITPQRSDTPRPSLNSGLDKSFTKNPVPLIQGQTRTAPLVGQSRLAVPPGLSSQTGQPIQIVTQGVTQTVTLAASQPVSQASMQTPMQVVATSQPTVSAAAGSKARPIPQQGAQVTTLPTNAPAVVLAAPARLASPGLIGVQTGGTRLAVATALPGSHQMLQTARLPPAQVPVRRGVVSLHPVLGVPLKPAPAPAPPPTAATSASTTSSPAGTPMTITQVQVPASSATQQPQPPSLRSLPALPTQSKMIGQTPNTAVMTVAAVGGATLRPVVAAVAAGATTTTLAPGMATTMSSTVASTAASKPGTYPQTLTTVSARPVAVAGISGQPVRPGPGQPSVYIQTTGHRASPGPTGERSAPFPIQSAYFYEAPAGSFVAGRTYATGGGTPYIVQATAARPVGAAPQQVHGIPSATNAASSASGSTTSVPVGSVATTVVSSASAAPVSSMGSIASIANVVSTVVSSVAQQQSQSQPPRFNSIMVLDPSRTALPIHAVVPAEGGATGTTYIAADGSLLPVQALPVSAAASQNTSTAASATSTASTHEGASGPGPAQIVASVVSQPVTSASAGHLPMQIQMVPGPVHIQMQSATASQSQSQTATSQPVTMSLAMSHQVLTHAVPVSISSHPSGPVAVPHLAHPSLHPGAAAAPAATPTPTTPIKANASPRPSILRKRDNEGSPMKAQKNLTPLLQSMSSNPSATTVSLASAVIPLPHALSLPLAHPPSPPSPPKRPDSSGPQSSGSTTISATSSPGQESPPVGTNQPPPSAASITAGLHAAGLGTEMSPRKKPRKQQLTGNELQEHKLSDEEMEFLNEDNGDDFPLNQQPQEPQQLHQQVLQQQQELLQQQQQQAAMALPPPPPVPREFTLKRPNISLLSTYRYSWKSRNNHFLRHSDVKPKDERRPSVNELASQRHIYQRLNGWKVHHLTAQMEDLAEVESQVCEQLESLLGMMERKAEQDEDRDVNRVSELIKGNMQRSRVIADQLTEAKAAVMKIFEHKPHVSDIIHRSSGKRERIFKKREKS